MTRPAAALTSGLLVPKGMARPLVLERMERPGQDVALTFLPFERQEQSNGHRLPPLETGPQATRARNAARRLASLWGTLASRWGLPTILFVVGLGMVSVVAVTGPGPAPAVASAKIAVQASRPLGPTPVTWVDHGLLANPALAGR